METRSLGEVICNHLNGKRFILVLDDVWEKDVWIKIMNVFPANCISRFVLTSRHKEVASLATSSVCIMGLELLEERHSWELFCNVAFRNNDDKRCPIELHDLAAKFIKICEGLPLAITCIGHLLFFKHPTHSEWKKVHDDLVLQLTKHVIPGVDMILKLSLEDLPYELKNCFLHCALFPEDYEMNRKRLIRHWIAAGFIIVQRGNQALEEVAEGYLNELVNRSLLQVVERNEFGRVRRCRMHDIVRHLALDKAENEGFGIIYEDSTTFPAGVTRRLSIESTNFELPSQSSVRHIRAVHAFTSSISVDLLRQIFASSNLLSTLDLQGTQIKILPDVVFNLFNLRFLSLRYCEIEVLPEAVGRLVNLEVLDAYSTRLLSLPKGVAKLKKLKFLYVWAFSPDFNVFDCGTEVPRGIRNLTGLHTLQSVKANFETLCGIAALSELRTFAISNKLSLVGQLEKKQIPQILLSWSHLMSLTRLSLAFTKLDDDSFSSLRALRGLCRLELSKAYDGTTLCFPTKSFPRLRFLGIMGAAQLNHVDIEEGALESLVDLMFIQCPELKHLPHGIEYLAALKELRLEDTATQLIEKLRKKHEADEEFMKISHIRKVFVMLTEKNIWERVR
ncbi:hypothetical protein PR202_gb16856 [Eleusine coracana subsp. coracana]|uniref:NB-ARC domain-containing protein n=1 Tax=Eleusine coracana subsp. coracana TaxID=191504 RepID=A0AAV5F1E1_ELECO|nr:hypothetical protein PR202_gb16856 [Eleusine coracana subsp. coracana]